MVEDTFSFSAWAFGLLIEADEGTRAYVSLHHHVRGTWSRRLPRLMALATPTFPYPSFNTPRDLKIRLCIQSVLHSFSGELVDIFTENSMHYIQQRTKFKPILHADNKYVHGGTTTTAAI